MDFGGRHCTLHAYTHRDLRQYLGLHDGEDKIRDYHTYTVEPDPRLIERFGRDTVPVYPKPGNAWQFHIDPVTHTFVDEWGTNLYMPPDGYFFDIASVPLATAETAADLDDYPWPDPNDPVRVAGLAEAVAAAHAAGKAAMICSARSGIWTTVWYLCGFEKAYMDTLLNPALAEALAERITDWHIAYWGHALDQIGADVDIVHLEGDLGGSLGPLFSPATFRKLYKTHFARLVSFIKARTKAKTFIHSCGSVRWVLPDLIECGIDILNPVQVNAADMDTALLKRDFGRDLTFWGGGCNPVVLQRGTPQEVADEVKRRVADLAPGGGFVFGSVHNVPAGVPPENIVAMYDTAREVGVY